MNRYQPAPPKITGEQAASNLGLTLDPRNNLYYNNAGQYYSAPTYQAPSSGYNPYTGFVNPLKTNTISSPFRTTTQAKAPEGQLSNNNYLFNPFTGSAEGVSAGQRSAVWDMLQRQKAMQAPQVATLQDLFPNMTAPTGLLQNTGNFGAGRFTANAPSFDFTAPK